MNPWNALMPYEINSEKKFCGRDDETKELVSLIKYNQIVTLYGKSGIGKTSLLNAGVYPVLKWDNYIPYSIELGSYFNDDRAFSQIILEEVFEGSITSLDYKKTNVFCDCLSNHDKRNEFEELLIPVILLDQFEQVLLNEKEKAILLLKQIAEWNNYQGQMASDFHFVISIREDDLYLLEDLIDSLRLTTLRNARFRLTEVSEKGAIDIIRLPAGEYIKDDSVTNEILEIVSNVDNSGRNSYDVTALSLLCYQLFSIIEAKKEPNITLDIVRSHGHLSIKKYYRDALQNLSERDIAILEDRFITDDGRRNFISENDFIKIFSSSIRETLTKGKNQILKITGDSVSVIHDLLAKAIKEVKEEHLIEQSIKKQKKDKWLYMICLSPVYIIISIVLWGFLPYILNRVSKNVDVESIFDIFLCNDDVFIRFIVIIISALFLPIVFEIFRRKNTTLSNVDKENCLRIDLAYWAIILIELYGIYYMHCRSWIFYVSFLPPMAYLLCLKPLSLSNTICLGASAGFSAMCFLIKDGILYMSVSFLLFIFVIPAISKESQKTRNGLLVIPIMVLIYGFAKDYFLQSGWICIQIGVLICIILKYKKSISKTILSSIGYLCVAFLTLGANPIFFLQGNSIRRIVMHKFVVIKEKDSIYIKKAWNMDPYWDWPLIAGKSPKTNDGNTYYGILPISTKEIASNSCAFFPFMQRDTMGYYVKITPQYVEGLRNLNEYLNKKLSSEKASIEDFKQDDLIDNPKLYIMKQDYKFNKEFLYPIEKETAVLFNEIMQMVIRDNIRNNAPLQGDDIKSFDIIDSICTNFLDTLKKDYMNKKDINEHDIRNTYKILSVQLLNAMIRDMIKENNVDNVLKFSSLFQFIVLGTEELYNTVNVEAQVDIIEDNKTKEYTISNKHIINNITYNKRIFDVIRALAKMQVMNYLTDDIKKLINAISLNKGTYSLMKLSQNSSEFKEIEEVLNNIDNTKYLHTVCKKQKATLKNIIENVHEDDIYSSVYLYFYKKIAGIYIQEDFGNSYRMTRIMYNKQLRTDSIQFAMLDSTKKQLDKLEKLREIEIAILKNLINTSKRNK